MHMLQFSKEHINELIIIHWFGQKELLYWKDFFQSMSNMKHVLRHEELNIVVKNKMEREGI